MKQKQDGIKRWERLLRGWEAIRTWIAWGSKLEEGSWYDEAVLENEPGSVLDRIGREKD